jgi:hypothetical protein
MDDGVEALHEVAQLKDELAACRRDAALVIHALDRSCQLIEALMLWLPEGQVMSPGLATAHEAWRRAMQAIRR